MPNISKLELTLKIAQSLAILSITFWRGSSLYSFLLGMSGLALEVSQLHLFRSDSRTAMLLSSIFSTVLTSSNDIAFLLYFFHNLQKALKAHFDHFISNLLISRLERFINLLLFPSILVNYLQVINLINWLGVMKMKTEDIKLDVKKIFDKKGVKYHRHDIAHARFVCRQIIGYLIDCQRRATCKDTKQS